MITIRSTTPCECCAPCPGDPITEVDVPNMEGYETYAGDLRLLSTGLSSYLTMECRVRGGTAELCGWSEYTGYASTPPRKYLRKVFGGGLTCPLYTNSPDNCTTPLARVNWPLGVTASGVILGSHTTPWSMQLGPGISSDDDRFPDWHTYAGPRSPGGLPAQSFMFTLNHVTTNNATRGPFQLRELGSLPTPTFGYIGSCQANGYLSTRSSGLIQWRVWMLVGGVGYVVQETGWWDLGVDTSCEETYNASGEHSYDPDVDCGAPTTSTGRLWGERFVNLPNAVIPFDSGVGGVTSVVAGSFVPDSCRVNATTVSATLKKLSTSGSCCALIATVRGKVAGGGAALTDTLSDEDTEDDAIDRLLAGAGGVWDDWALVNDAGSGACATSECCRAHWYDRTSGFTFAYQEAQWRIKPTDQTVDPGCYTVVVDYFRRVAGSGGAWTAYATSEPVNVLVRADGTAQMLIE